MAHNMSRGVALLVALLLLPSIAAAQEGYAIVTPGLVNNVSPTIDPTSIAVGLNAGSQINAANQFATIFGYQAGAAQTNTLYTTAFGYQALQSLVDTNAIANTALGYQSLQFTTTGQHNTGLGGHALWFNTTGSGNIGVGPNSGESGTTASNGTFIGYFAGIGSNALIGGCTCPNTGNNNVAMGSTTLQYLQGAAAGNTALGTAALGTATTASNNVAVGYSSLLGITGTPLTGGSNVGIGNNAMNTIQGAANSNVAVGTNAGFNLTTANFNTAVGNNALQGSGGAPLTGNFNTGVGASALLAIQGAATNNTATGTLAMATTTTGQNNTALGASSQQGSGTAPTGSGNTSVGFQSLKSLSGAGASNTVIGAVAGGNITTGSNNIALGQTTLPSVVAGSNNIAIGFQIDTPSATDTSNTLNLAAILKVTGINTPATAVSTLRGSTVALPDIATATSALDYLCWNAATGALTADGAGTCLVSLEELKDIVEPIAPGQALATALALKPFFGKYKDSVESVSDHRVHPMFGAHQVEGVDPRLASYDNATGELRGVRYMEMTAVLDAAIQAQQAQIADLSARVTGMAACWVAVHGHCLLGGAS